MSLRDEDEEAAFRPQALLRQLTMAAPLAQGWRCQGLAELRRCATLIAGLDADSPQGRDLVDPDSQCTYGAVSRLALVHFDAQGCFAGAPWDRLVTAFRDGTRRNPVIRLGRRRRQQACSDSVTCCVEGVDVDLKLVLSTIDEDPEFGIFFGLDAEAFDPYFLAPGGLRHLDNRRRDVLRVTCTMRCGAVEQHSGYVLALGTVMLVPTIISYEVSLGNNTLGRLTSEKSVKIGKNR